MRWGGWICTCKYIASKSATSDSADEKNPLYFKRKLERFLGGKKKKNLQRVRLNSWKSHPAQNS